MSALVGRCVASWERGRVRIAPWQVERGFGPIFGAPKSGQEKAFGALLRHWPLTAARSADCHGGFHRFEIDADYRTLNVLWLLFLVKMPVCPVFAGPFWEALTLNGRRCSPG